MDIGRETHGAPRTRQVGDAIRKWIEALRSYLARISSYADEIEGGAPPRAKPPYRTAQAAAAVAMSAAASMVSASATGTGPEAGVPGGTAAGAFKALDLFASAMASLETAAAGALLGEHGGGAWTKSWAYVRRLRQSAAAVRAAAPAFTDPPVAEIEAAFAASGRSPPGARLYARALAVRARRGGDVGAQAENAKEMALGLPADKRADIEAAMEERAGFHPLVSMLITFGYSPSLEESTTPSTESGPTLDLSLGARGTDRKSSPMKSAAPVSYDPFPLFRGSASVTIFAGLSWPLIKRLETIRIGANRIREPSASPVPSAADGGPACGRRPGRGEGPDWSRTIDGGLTRQALVPPVWGRGPENGLAWAGAGPRRRVEKCGGLLVDALTEAGVIPAAPSAGPAGAIDLSAADEIGASALISSYESWLDSDEAQASRMSLTALGPALERAILPAPSGAADRRAAGMAGIDDLAPFVEAVAVAVAAAPAGLMGPGLQARVDRYEAGEGGAMGLTAADARREYRLTGLWQAWDSAESVRKRFLEALAAEPPALPAAAPASDGRDEGVYSALTRETVRRLAGRVSRGDSTPTAPKTRLVEKTGALNPPLTLKIYAMTHGKAERRRGAGRPTPGGSV